MTDCAHNNVDETVKFSSHSPDIESSSSHSDDSIQFIDEDENADAEPVKLYPNCDATVWLRSCEHEIIEPLAGTQSGRIPRWLHGSLLRNGPGSLKVGAMRFNHLFDSAALLHRFGIADGRVTYQCRFVQTDTYRRNRAAQRIVVSEFGTAAVPDPCHTIFQRVAAVFSTADWSDNTMISVYPMGDEYFAFTEYPIIHSIDAETLATRRKLNVMDYTGILSHTSHPHVLADGTAYNLGMTVGTTGPQYNVICFPAAAPHSTDPDAMFRRARVVATVPCRWKLHPGYMHTFGLTARFFVIVEQPLSVSVAEMARSQIRSRPMVGAFRWFGDQPTCVHVVSRRSGRVVRTFEADAFFYLHVINAYDVEADVVDDSGDAAEEEERVEYVVIDICCYRDPAMLDCMYVEAMETMQQNPDYARMFRGRPMRFVLPLRAAPTTTQRWSQNMRRSASSVFQMPRSMSVADVLAKLTRSASEHRQVADAFHYRSMAQRLDDVGDDEANGNPETSGNLVQMRGTTATAFWRSGSELIFCQPERLCDLGCETPRINYEVHMGRLYRYFYAISSDVDAENSGTVSVK